MDYIKIIQEFFSKPTTLDLFIKLTLLFSSLFLVLFITQKIMNSILLCMKFFKNLLFRTKIVNEFLPFTTEYQFAITEEDIKKYLKKVKKHHRRDVKGIRRIILKERSSLTIPTALASYEPRTQQINLFPLMYQDSENTYYVPVNGSYIRLNETQAKEYQLFCLGHEIGHHVAYTKTGLLHGQEVERFCDVYSEDLKIVPNHEKNFKKKDLVLSPISL